MAEYGSGNTLSGHGKPGHGKPCPYNSESKIFKPKIKFILTRSQGVFLVQFPPKGVGLNVISDSI
jgi:hypothetical protein